MKKIFLILSILISFTAKSQWSTVTQGNSKTLTKYLGGYKFDSSCIIPILTDTANYHYKDSIGCIIYYSGNSYLRYGGKWNKILTGTAGTVTSIGIIGSDFSISNSPITSSGNIGLTLAIVNATTGNFGNQYSIPAISVNGKGLITNVTNNPIPDATNSVKGLLTATDRITFEAKQNANTNLTAGYGITGSVYNGNTARTWVVDTAGAIASKLYVLAHSGGASGIDDVLALSQSLTADRSIDIGSNTFNIGGSGIDFSLSPTGTYNRMSGSGGDDYFYQFFGGSYADHFLSMYVADASNYLQTQYEFNLNTGNGGTLNLNSTNLKHIIGGVEQLIDSDVLFNLKSSSNTDVFLIDKTTGNIVSTNPSNSNNTLELYPNFYNFQNSEVGYSAYNYNVDENLGHKFKTANSDNANSIERFTITGGADLAEARFKELQNFNVQAANINVQDAVIGDDVMTFGYETDFNLWGKNVGNVGRRIKSAVNGEFEVKTTDLANGDWLPRVTIDGDVDVANFVVDNSNFKAKDNVGGNLIETDFVNKSVRAGNNTNYYYADINNNTSNVSGTDTYINGTNFLYLSSDNGSGGGGSVYVNTNGSPFVVNTNTNAGGSPLYIRTNELTAPRTIYPQDVSGSPLMRVASGIQNAQTSAVSSVATYTPTNSGLFEIGAYLTVTAISASTLNLVVTYTDETNTARTQTFVVMGTTSPNISSTGAYTFSNITISSKDGTPITVSTTAVGVSRTYNVGANIIKVR